MTAPRVAGLAVLALGVACLVATFAINGDGFALEGPRLAPLVTAIVLIVLAVVFIARPDRELAERVEREHRESHAATPAALVGLLIGYAALLTTLGYALATTAFVWLTAWLLGSTKPVRDGVVALVLGVVVSLAFSRLLGVRLPEGPWGA